MIQEIETKTKVATEQNNVAFEKRAVAEKQAGVIVKEKSKADSALMEALPAVEAAAEALNNIRRDDLQELKAFNNPPIHVKIVCQMCAVLRPSGEKLNESWTDSKKMLGNSKLLDLLKDYPKDSIKENMYRRCKQILKANEEHDITVENLSTKSKAGKGLLVWVLAILRYYEVARNVEPLRSKVKDMERAQAKTEAELSHLKSMLECLDQEIIALRNSYNNAKSELTSLQKQAFNMEKNLQSASQLVEGLGGEKKRWQKQISELVESKNKILGNCLLSSSFLSYLGAFTSKYRRDLMKKLHIDIVSKEIPVSKNLNIPDTFLPDNCRQNWINMGLPPDVHSIENGILTTYGNKFPLCIDPQMQALAWIKNIYKDQNLCIKSVSNIDFVKHIELAIQFGNPFLCEIIEEDIDPFLYPILENGNSHGTSSITLGDKTIEWDKDFRLFICTKQSNPSYSPEIISKVTIVNYCVTKLGLTDQLLNVIVSHERPVSDYLTEIASLLLSDTKYTLCVRSYNSNLIL